MSMENRPPVPKPSIASLTSDYQKLLLKHGAVPELHPDVSHGAFELACGEWPKSWVQPVLAKYVKEGFDCEVLWPWAALACQQYKVEHLTRKRSADALRPIDIERLIQSIQKTSSTLLDDLCQLQTLGFGPSEPTAPDRNIHISWLDHQISLAVLNDPNHEQSVDTEAVVKAYWARKALMDSLLRVELRAKALKEAIDRSVLKKTKPLKSPELYNLVWRAAMIWKVLTGRVASVNKATRNDQQIEGSGQVTDPDFVCFVGDLALIAGQSRPTRKMVETAHRHFLSRQKKDEIGGVRNEK